MSSQDRDLVKRHVKPYLLTNSLTVRHVCGMCGIAVPMAMLRRRIAFSLLRHVAHPRPGFVVGRASSSPSRAPRSHPRPPRLALVRRRWRTVPQGLRRRRLGRGSDGGRRSPGRAVHPGRRHGGRHGSDVSDGRGARRCLRQELIQGQHGAVIVQRLSTYAT